MLAYRTEGENGAVISNGIKPFCKFLPARLPKKSCQHLKVALATCLCNDGRGIGNKIPEHLTTAIVNNLYE
jgi:hypothetical protein